MQKHCLSTFLSIKSSRDAGQRGLPLARSAATHSVMLTYHSAGDPAAAIRRSAAVKRASPISSSKKPTVTKTANQGRCKFTSSARNSTSGRITSVFTTWWHPHEKD